MTYPFNLGTYSRAVSDVAEAQLWFDRGLNWLFGYNHEEAIACFEASLSADPDLGLAHWGIAYAIGPNYNKPWDVFAEDERTTSLYRAHAEIAAARASRLSPLEAALVEALATRYPTDPATEDFQPWADRYAAAMRPVYAGHSDDLDVAFLFAEALMVRTPWQLWDLAAGRPADGAFTIEARDVLERAFGRAEAWDHPGLLHMYIHLMEMSPTPEAALRHGDRLTGLVPDSGHLVHMATHIDVLCGDYQNVVARNRAASGVDAAFKAYAGAANFYALYRIHNLHFELYGAMFLAQPTAALDAAARLLAEVPEEVVRVYPELFEAFVAARPHVLVRFGMWEAILEERIPDDTDLYAFTQALVLYARTVALANLGRIAEATEESARFMVAFGAIPDERKLFQNTARDVLAVGREMMQGEIAFKAGRRGEGLAHLRRAVRLEDGLMYEEPWAWPQPTRHALGALLLEDGQWEEAERVYRADLGLDPSLPRPLQHPQNVWALQGLHECLQRRDAGVEAIHVGQQLARAQARAEVRVSASCFCRGSGA